MNDRSEKWLKNWERWKAVRKKQQDKLKEQTSRKPEKLLMNASEGLIQGKWGLQTVPNYFKNENKNQLEFWQEPTYIQKTCQNLFDSKDKSVCTLNKYFDRRDKHLVPYKEYWGVPKTILNEKGFEQEDFEFVKKIPEPKLSQLAVIGKKPNIEQVPDHILVPQINTFEVKEKRLEFENISNSKDTKIPRIKIQEEILPYRAKGKKQLKTSYQWTLSFSSSQPQFFKLENLGQYRIIYKWLRLLPKNRKQLPVKAQLNLISQFHFIINDGILLPGQKVNINIAFKNNIEGLFWESWQLFIEPKILERNPYFLDLIGYCKTKENPYCTKINNYLNENIKKFKPELITNSEKESKKYLNLFFSQLMTEERFFMLKNQCLNYNSDDVVQLKSLHRKFSGEDWDMSIATLYNEIFRSSFSNNEKEKYLNELKKIVERMKSTYTQGRLNNEKYEAVHIILCLMANKIDEEGKRIRIKFYGDEGTDVSIAVSTLVSSEKSGKKKSVKGKSVSLGSKQKLIESIKEKLKGTILEEEISGKRTFEIDEDSRTRYLRELNELIKRLLGRAVDQIAIVLESTHFGLDPVVQAPKFKKEPSLFLC